MKNRLFQIAAAFVLALSLMVGGIGEAELQFMRDFNSKLHTDDRIDMTLLPLADGLTLARKR